MPSEPDVTEQIKNAKAAAKSLRVLAVIAIIVGAGFFIATVALMFAGEVDASEGISLLVITGFGAIIGGAASFSSSWSLTLSAARTEMRLDRDNEVRRPGGEN